MYTGLIVGGGRSTESCNAIGIHSLAAAVHKRVVGIDVGVGTMCGRAWAGVATGVAVAVRVGHSAGQGSRCFAIGAGGGVAPASVAARVLCHLSLHAHSWKCRVMVGIEAVFFHLLPALVLVALSLLVLSPEEDGAKHEQCNYHNRDHDSDGCLTSGAQAARALLACAL